MSHLLWPRKMNKARRIKTKLSVSAAATWTAFRSGNPPRNRISVLFPPRLASPRRCPVCPELRESPER